MSNAYGINSGGFIVGSSGVPHEGGWPHAVTWTNGAIQELSNLSMSQALAVNDAGVIVGEVSGTGVKWVGGYVSYLDDGLLRMRSGQDINTAGQIAGFARVGEVTHAAVWNNGVVVDLGTLGGSYSYAYGINDQGQIVGRSYTGQRGKGNREIIEATLWVDGTVTILPRLGGEQAQARDINELGQIVGWYDYGAFIWENGQTTALGGGAHQAYAINENSQVVGQMRTSVGAWHAMLWQGGVTYDLNDLLVNGDDWSYLSVAFDINDAGQIVGGGGMTDDSFHAFLAQPIPEPATLGLLAVGALLALGGLGIVRAARRRSGRRASVDATIRSIASQLASQGKGGSADRRVGRRPACRTSSPSESGAEVKRCAELWRSGAPGDVAFAGFARPRGRAGMNRQGR